VSSAPSAFAIANRTASPAARFAPLAGHVIALVAALWIASTILRAAPLAD